MFNHDYVPPAFNPEYREGFGEALSEEYTRWSNAHPEHTREEGMKAHKEIAARLLEKFPSVMEKYLEARE